MDESKNKIKEVVKIVAKSLGTTLLIVALVLSIVLVFLGGALYYLTVDEGIYKEGDWSSVPYGASQFMNGTSVDDEGNIKSNMSSQELWDKLIKNKSKVADYLQGPKDLARMMKAEMVTKYPDLRPHPDAAINWEEVWENDDMTQGIIKFKRAKDDGNTVTMSYVKPDVFQSYIDEYNKNGSAVAKNNALTHFTLKENYSASGPVGELQVIDGVQMQLIEGNGRITHYNGDGSAMEGGSHNALGWNLADGQCAAKGLRDKAPYRSVIYIETKPSGEGSFGHGKFFYITDTGGGLKDNQVDIYARVSQHDLNRAPYGSTNGAKIYLVEKGVSWEEYLQKYHGKTLNPSNVGTADTSTTTEDDKKDKKEDTLKENTDSETTDTNTGVSVGQQIVNYALKFVGNRYVWGGASLTKGCDCSGFVGQILAKFGYVSQAKANVHGYVSGSFRTMGKKVNNLSEAIAGDVICYEGHVAIYDGKGKIVEAKGRNYGITHDRKADCKHIVAIRRFTDEKATGIPSDLLANESSSQYAVEIATWQQTETSLESNDPNVDTFSGKKDYNMTTTTIDYQAMTQQYTLPFDYLWALLVIGEERKLVFELADLAYNSDIEITVHDNLTVDTDIDKKTYTQQTKSVVEAKATAKCTCGSSKSKTDNHTHDPDPDLEKNYYATSTIVTKTNTVDVAVTRANVWIVDYKNKYTHEKPSTTTDNSSSSEPDTAYDDSPSSTGKSHSCDKIDDIKNEAKKGIKHQATTMVDINLQEIHSTSVSTDISVDYYERYVDINHALTHIVETTQYISGTPELKRKIDKDTAPNFVTVFNSPTNRMAANRIRDAHVWLYEILETNDSTRDMLLDLTKYLLYVSAGNDADNGLITFNFNIFYPSQLNNAGADGYVVHTQMDPNIVINDLATLKKAFKGYSRSEKLIEHAQEYLDLQKKYKVNAIFAAAVAIDETTAGTRGHAVDGKNNWYNIKDTSTKDYRNYSSASESIEGFYKQIAEGTYYFKQNKYSVHDIGMIYCENADKPGGWIENVNKFMAQMLKAAGISATPESGTTEFAGDTVADISNASTQAFVNKLGEISTFIRKNASHCEKKGKITQTFAKAKSLAKQGKTFRVNCVAPIQWALQDLGLIDKEGSFYGNFGSFTMSSSSRRKLTSKAKIMSGDGSSLNKAANSGKIIPGDIISVKITGFPNTRHTLVYAGKNSKGKIMAFEAGGNALGKGYRKVGCGPFDYSNWGGKYKVKAIVRIK